MISNLHGQRVAMLQHLALVVKERHPQNFTDEQERVRVHLR